MDLLICFSLIILIVICKYHFATAQQEFWGGGRYCGVSGNYTQDSVYRQNLDDALYNLLDTNNGFGFYNSTSGQANTAAVCRGDVDPDYCRRCVDDASRRIRQVCPNQIEAAGWYDGCYIWYSNRAMGYINVQFRLYSWSPQNASDGEWSRSVADLWRVLLPEAAGGGQLRKYASRNITRPGFWSLYGMMQCSPEMSETQCGDCLDTAVGLIRPMNRSLGGRVFIPGCALRYENYSFFNATWFPDNTTTLSPPPSQPPPSSGNTSIGVIIGPILAALVVIFIVVFFTFRRREKRNRTDSLLPELEVEFSEVSHEGEDDDTGEMNSFNLSIIQIATNNFSQENKLGEGGFGPVYKGKLQDGKEIAVKRLSMNSGQGLVEFKTEVNLIIKLQHKNLVRLLGYCVKGSERLLIYEFMANNSLDAFLLMLISVKN